MRYGNMVLRSRPEEAAQGVCAHCGNPCEERIIDASFSDHFGWVEDWESDGSDCCGAEVLTGKSFETVTHHTARKDHLRGSVKKGDYYRKIFRRSYYYDENGEKQHAQESQIIVIRRATEANN